MDLKQYVVVYAPTFGDKLPMVLKNKPDFLKGVLNLPGGKIEDNESPASAAIRELKEETGLSPRSQPQLIGLIRGTKSEIHVIKCPVNDAPIKPAEGETEIFDWYDLQGVLKHPCLMPNLRLVLPLCYSSIAGWEVYDCTGDWRGMYHHIQLKLYGTDYLIETKVHGMSYYKDGE